jgi:hypothetical protein
MAQMLAAMDEELMHSPARSVMGQTFTAAAASSSVKRVVVDHNEQPAMGEEEEAGAGGVDIDANALNNFLQSIEQQHGLPGPASVLLQSMGLTDNWNKS